MNRQWPSDFATSVDPSYCSAVGPGGEKGEGQSERNEVTALGCGASDM